MPGLSIAKALEELLEARVVERLSALESRLAADRTQASTHAPSQPGGPLRAAIVAILADHPDETLSAKEVLAELMQRVTEVEKAPSLRTVQWHLRQMRNAQ